MRHASTHATARRRLSFTVALTFAFALATSCADDGSGALREGAPAYGIVKGCYALGLDRPARYLATDGSGAYRLLDAPSDADRFFLQAAALGRFLLYDQDRGFVAAGAGGLERRDGPDDASVWIVRELGEGGGGQDGARRVTLVSEADGRRLAIDLEGRLALVGSDPGDGAVEPGAVVELLPREPSLCAAFPEDDVDAVVEAGSLEGSGDPDAPVVGYADIHSHLSFPRAMGATVMAGDAFHRFGIEHALGDCRGLHGPGGVLDVLGLQAGPGGHDTLGYPEFPYWPRHDTTTHVVTYYQWLRRAHLGGLRLLVTHATGDPTICDLSALLHPHRLQGDCSARATVDLQNRYVLDLEDYVDAQSGGPGLGWFRVVRSPAEARRAIAEGKLAVVLGVEYSLLFECRAGDEGCTPEHVDRELDRLHDVGVRVVFPVHKFDNAFGGAALQGGAAGGFVNLANKLSTGSLGRFRELLDPAGSLLRPIGGHYLEVEPCPEGVGDVRGVRDMRDMRAFLEEDLGFLRDLLGAIPAVGAIADAAFFRKLEPLPDYAEVQGVPACNVRPLEPIGRHLVEGLVDRGMIVEVDHLSDVALRQTLDLLEARGYPGLVSSHGWIDGRAEIRDRIFGLGGLMTVISGGPERFASWVARTAADMERHGAPVIGVPFATDVQGIVGLPGPGEGVTISYPLRSFDGRVRFERPSVGHRVFDYPTEGVAHYGLFPEWVEELRQVSEAREDGVDVLGIFMRSAEAYLQLWERAEASASDDGVLVEPEQPEQVTRRDLLDQLRAAGYVTE